MVSTDATFVLAAIAAHERRVTATLDLPGAFLHADNDSFVIMKMTGSLAELMVKTAPTLYQKYVIKDSSGKPMLYVQLQKALYGMLKSALLFYRKLVTDLTNMGSKLNPYNPCMANKSQGYSIDENIIYQDNMSTLLLEKNGSVSRSNRTKHIKAKYYLVQDKYNSHEIDLKYCPTNAVWADVLTKPLQGLKFQQMRTVLMNCLLDYFDQ